MPNWFDKFLWYADYQLHTRSIYFALSMGSRYRGRQELPDFKL